MSSRNISAAIGEGGSALANSDQPAAATNL
jgi:hypothetical protein